MMSRKIFALLVTAFFVYVASPLLMPVVMGGLFAVVLFPLLEWLQSKRWSPILGSSVLTFIVTLLLIVPISLLLYMAAKMGFDQLKGLKESPQAYGDWLEALLASPTVQRVMNTVTDFYPISHDELVTTLHDVGKAIALRLSDYLGLMLARLPGLALGLVVMVVSIYFFLVDGRALVVFIRRHSFFNPQQTDQLVDTLEVTCRSVIVASLVSGITQALFESLACFVAGVPNVALIGALVFISSFVPVVGTAPVTFGVAIHQFLIGRTGAGIALLITATLVSAMDNFIRPWFLKGSVNLHPLLAFVAAFGGLQTLGFAGVFLGPIIAALFVATMQLISTAEQKD